MSVRALSVSRGRSVLARAMVLTLALPAAARGLTLEEAVDLALARNERLGIAERDRDAARARLDQARSALMPSVDASATRLRRGRASIRDTGGGPVVVQGRDALFGALDVELPLWDARAWPLLRAARLGAEQAQLELHDVRRRLVRDTSEAFVLALSAAQVVEAARRRLEFARTGLEDVRARVEAGLVSSNDATKVGLEAATAERELTRTELSAESARLELELLTGAEVATPLVPPDWLLGEASQAPPAAESMIALAHDRRADVAARWRLADGLRALAREPPLRAVPRFDLFGGVDVSDEAGTDEDWRVGVDMTWQIFDGGLRAAERRERSFGADAAALEASLLEREVRTEVERALVELDSARSGVTQSAVALELARDNAEETTALYRQGLRPALEVASAGVQVFEAEVALLRERYGLALAHLDLVSATGGDPLAHRTAQ